MIPSSVKNERSLWLHAVCRAWTMASVSCMSRKLTMRIAEFGMRNERAGVNSAFHTPHSALPSFVSQRFHRVEPGGPTGGAEAESHAGQGRAAERGDKR